MPDPTDPELLSILRWLRGTTPPATTPAPASASRRNTRATAADIARAQGLGALAADIDRLHTPRRPATPNRRAAPRRQTPHETMLRHILAIAPATTNAQDLAQQWVRAKVPASQAATWMRLLGVHRAATAGECQRLGLHLGTLALRHGGRTLGSRLRAGESVDAVAALARLARSMHQRGTAPTTR